MPFPVSTSLTGTAWRGPKRLVLTMVLLSLPWALYARAETPDATAELAALTAERQMLARELEQYESTLAVLQSDGTPPEESSNPAVRTLARETVRINERLIAITEREVALLQEQIIQARSTVAQRSEPEVPEPAQEALESKPIRTTVRDFSAKEETENVNRLYELLTMHYAEVQEAARTLPSEEEVARREAALRDAETLAKIPFNPDKVRLSGAEGSTALSQITRRLSDPNLPESRRDITPICSIKTRLFGSLIASENRSLIPVGKNHYVARIRLQPGDSTLRINGDLWQVRLPRDVNAGEYVLTLYQPQGSRPELHVFSVNDLMAEDRPHIPAWLPQEMNLKPRAG